MYHFEVHLKETGEVLQKGRPSDYGKIKNWVALYFEPEHQKLLNFFVKGVEVSFDEMLEECWNEEDGW